MPLPAATPQNSLGSVPIGAIPQMVQAPNLQLLTAGLQSGVIHQGDLEDQLTKIALRKREQASAAAAQQDLQTLPIRRQQEMQAHQQASQLNDIQIKTAQRNFDNPFVATEQANQAKDLSDYDEATNYAAKPLDQNGKIDWAAVRMTTRAAKQKQVELDNTNKAALQEDERANAAHQTQFGYVPKIDGGGVDRATRDANLKDFGGKQLPEGATDVLGAIDQSKVELDALDKLFKDRAAGTNPIAGTGPLTGMVAKVNPYDTNRKMIDAQNAGAVQVLARGVFRERGMISDNKIKAMMMKLPSVTDTPDQATSKITALRNELDQSKAITLDELKKAGKETKRFETPAAGVTPTPAAGTAVVKSQADWDKLPAGSVYQLEDGRRFTKAAR